MNVAIASILQENNTFSPVYSRLQDFSPVYGTDALRRHESKLTEMGGFIDVLSRAQATIVPIMAGWAITANGLLEEDFTRLSDQFECGLRQVRADAVLLALHGAQVAVGEDDVAGHLLARTREVVGPDKPVIVTLDLHANITKRMTALADAIVGYHTYPHIDMFETGQKAARLLLRILAGEVRPAMAYRKLPLIVPAENSQTTSGPFHSLMSGAEELEERGEAEAISLFPVQPWLDISEMGSAVVAVTNGNPKTARQMADCLARRFWNTKGEFEITLTPVPKAIAGALALEQGPAVLAESADSTGSGSPGDSTGVLKHLLAAPLDGPAAIFLVDPAGVAKAVAAGVGATVTMEIGGGFDKVHSTPVQVTGYIRLISDGRWVARARGYNTGITNFMGRAVVLEAGQVQILMAERSAMTVDPALFRSHGIDPLYCRIVVVKSPNGFRAAYEPIAKAIYVVDTPGVSTANLKSLPFQRVPRPIYPLDPETTFPEAS